MVNFTCSELWLGITDSTVSRKERKIEADFIRQLYKNRAEEIKKLQALKCGEDKC